MHIIFYTRYSIDQIFLVAQWVSAFFLFVLFLFFSFSLFQFKAIFPALPVAKREISLDFDKMVSGSLQLRQKNQSILGLALEQKLKFLGQSDRPGAGENQKVLCLAINGSEQCRIVKEKEPIYLQVIEHPNGGIEKLSFSDTKTDKWIIPQALQESSLLLRIEGKDSSELCLSSSSKVANLSQLDPKILELQKAKWWGEDLFFRKYGGEEYSRLGQKQKIELGDETSRYALFISSGDFLSFLNGKWEVLDSLENARMNAPLAQIISVQPNQIEMKAWDTEGFFLFNTKLFLEKKAPLRVFFEQLVTEAKLRSAKQATCKIEKKRILLRPGDWLIKSQTNWHKLVTFSEIESYLNGKLIGELIVVDGIDSNGKIQGNYFDSMRTQMQPFAIRAASSKRKSIQKKNNPSKQ